MTKRLTIEEMAPLFNALNGGQVKLSDALDQIVVLAKKNKLSIGDLTANLNELGINLTDNFVSWLNTKFAGGR